MKRTLLATAVGLTFIAASAPFCLAQSYSDRSDSAQYGDSDQGPTSQDRNGSSDRRWQHEQRGRYSQSENENEYGPVGRGPGGPPPPPHHPPPPPQADAAHFVFQRGPARVDITCPQAFALQDCIQAASELLDKIESLRAGAQHADGQHSDANNPPAPSGGNGRGAAPSGTPQSAPRNHGEGEDNRM